MPETANWFYAKNGQQYGPCTPSLLKQYVASGQVVRSDLVWTEGMTDWKPASEINGLCAVTPVRPPAPPKVIGVSPPTSFPSIAASPKVAQKPLIRKQPVILVSVIVAVVLVIVLAVMDDSTKPRRHRPAIVQQTRAILPEQAVKTAPVSKPGNQNDKTSHAKQSGDTQTKQVTQSAPASNAGADTLTADYLLLTPGKVRMYVYKMYVKETPRMVATHREVSKSDGMIEGEMTIKLPGPPVTQTYTGQIRTSREFVEVEGRPIGGGLRIKLGARPGDTWDGGTEGKDVLFTFVGLRDIEEVGASGPYTIRRALIERLKKMDDKGGAIRTEYRLDKGIGLVSERGFHIFNNEPESLPATESVLTSDGQ